jgi:hypothetical protein
MNKTIKNLLIFFTIFLVFTITLLCTLKIQVVANCVFVSDENTTSISVNKHIHHYISNKSIKECHIEVNQTKYKAWLNFKNTDNNNFTYWLSVDNTFAFNNQTSYVNVDFGKLNIINYVYYLFE